MTDSFGIEKCFKNCTGKNIPWAGNCPYCQESLEKKCQINCTCFDPTTKALKARIEKLTQETDKRIIRYEDFLKEIIETNKYKMKVCIIAQEWREFLHTKLIDDAIDILKGIKS